MEPFDILKEAIKKVPAMRYALAVAALVAVVAIIASFQLDPKVAVIGSVLVLGAMVVIAVFAKLTSTAKKHFLKPVLVMMWAFLVLVIAMATLLLTAVAFRWPPGLAEWLFPRGPAGVEAAKSSGAQAEIPAERLAAIRMQSEAGDYAAAWGQLEEAMKEAPESEEGFRLQASIAMRWLRSRYYRDDGPLVDRLSPTLYRAANRPDKVLAADAHAHIGWGNFLKTIGGSGLDYVAEFRRALELDPENVYAHAMWGYTLLWTANDKFDESMEHFDRALKTGEERGYIRFLQLDSLARQRFDKHVLDLIRISNDARKNGDRVSLSLRDEITWHAYLGNWEEILASINSSSPVLSPTEHLATIEWLNESGKQLSPYAQFFKARLREQTGDRAAALAVYREMSNVENPGVAYSDLATEITQGIARCQM